MTLESNEDHKKTVILIESNNNLCERYKNLFSDKLPEVILKVYSNTTEGLKAIFRNNFDVAIINSNLFEDNLDSSTLVRKCVLSGKPVVCTENNIIKRLSLLYYNSDIKNKNIGFIGKNDNNILDTVQHFFSKKIDPLIISSEMKLH